METTWKPIVLVLAIAYYPFLVPVRSIFGSRSFEMIAKSGENIVKKCKRHLIKC